jgi:ribosomal protein S12 methylthiotransferase accessory factor YcaO
MERDVWGAIRARREAPPTPPVSEEEDAILGLLEEAGRLLDRARALLAEALRRSRALAPAPK